jgi:predicted ATPase
MAQAASAKRASSVPGADEAQQGITAITVQGYKSIDDEVTVSIAPLTILAGANSSGKSSLMQPLLLMKQTLEAPYDPGALLLNGANLKFTSADQLFSLRSPQKSINRFKTGIEVCEGKSLFFTFEKHPQKLIDLSFVLYKDNINEYEFSLYPSMDHESILKIFPENILENTFNKIFEKTFENASKEELQKLDLWLNDLGRDIISETVLSQLKDRMSNELGRLRDPLRKSFNFRITRDRCFFDIDLVDSSINKKPTGLKVISRFAAEFKNNIQNIIHVPGLRGNPERTYKTTAVGKEFPGTFENYVASVINDWQAKNNQTFKTLEMALQVLGLTSKIEAKQLDDTQVELRVGRLPYHSAVKNNKKDMVSIADVGFGVSQTLPVIVALLTARPGQLVYIEQPEIHLHPRAQVAIAEIFADAANRGVRVVVETHSELFLMGVQSLVAEGKLAPEKVKLHWFTRQENGNTKITSADLDESGSFGEDWPEDFAEVSLSIQNRYLNAAEAKLWRS